MTMDPKEYAYILVRNGFTFRQFERQWPNLASCEYGDIVKKEMERLQ